MLVWVSGFVVQGLRFVVYLEIRDLMGLGSMSVGLGFTPSGCKVGSLARDSGLGLGVCASGCKVGSLARDSGFGHEK